MSPEAGRAPKCGLPSVLCPDQLGGKRPRDGRVSGCVSLSGAGSSRFPKKSQLSVRVCPKSRCGAHLGEA